MKKRTLLCKLLSLALCASMTVPSLSVPVYASDGGVLQESETVVLPEDNVQEEEVLTASENNLENVVIIDGDLEVTEEQVGDCDWDEFTAQEESTTTLGTFEGIKYGFEGFKIELEEGTFYYAGSDTEESAQIYLAQYDEQNNRLCSSSVRYFHGTEPETMELGHFGGGILLNNTAYVRLEIVKGDVREWSEPYYVDVQMPDVSFEVEYVDAAVKTAWFDISVSGDMKLNHLANEQPFRAVLNVGTSEDKSTWVETGTNGTLTLCQDDTETVCIQQLAENTTYYGEIVVYVEGHDEETWDDSYRVRVMEQRIPLEPFTTKPNTTYSWEKDFPDAAWRAVVQDMLYRTTWVEVTGDEVTAADLEAINYISTTRSSFDTVAIKDITGVQLLKGIESLKIENHEIADVSEIDWSSLHNLGEFELPGNEITKLPDFSKNQSLYSWDLKENRLSEEELNNAFDKLPATSDFDYAIEDAMENQRVNGLEILMGDKSYVYSSGNHIFVKPVGYKSGLPYTLKWYLNGNEVTFTTEEYNDSNIYYLLNSGLTEGSHTLKAELYQGETKVEETKVYNFDVVNQPVFADKVQYISGDTRDNYSFGGNVYYNERGAGVASIDLVDGNGKIYARAERISNKNAYGDPRLEFFDYEYIVEENVSLKECSFGWDAVYNTTPAGSYQWKVNFTDGSSSLIEDAVVVLDKEEPIITSCYMAGNYDSTGEYFYVGLAGNNLEPEKYDYTITQNRKQYPVTYVNSKPSYSGVVVKLKKDGWRSFNGGNYGYDIEIVVDGGTEHTRYQEGYYYVTSGIYYANFNRALHKVEVALTEDLDCNGRSIQVNLRRDDEEDTEVLAQAEAVVHNNMAYLEFLNEDGTPYAYQDGDYQLELFGKYTYDISLYGMSDLSVAEISEEVESAAVTTMEEDNASNAEESDIVSQIIHEVTETVYDVENKQEMVEVKKTSVTENISDRESEDITGGSDTNSITENANAVVSKEDELTESEMETAAAEKFTISSLYASWSGENQIGISVNSPSATKNDKYTLVMEDCNGISPTGITTTYTVSDYGSINFTIKGLQYKDAAKKYFLKITHNTLGEPYNASGTNLYYTDERGAYTKITRYSMSSTGTRERTMAVSLYNETLPITLQVTKPYSTEVLKEVNIKSASELLNGYYYFTKDFCDSLPEKDVIYEVIIYTGSGRVTQGTMVIGCWENLQTNWSYKVDKTTLYFNEENEKTATIEVTGNTNKPTFKTSNTNAVTIKVDESNPNKAILTAVGVGTAEISITADGYTRRFVVTSKRKSTLESLVLSSTELILGANEVKKLSANVFPADVWTEDMAITFTTENNNIIALETESNSEVMVHGLQEGTAIVTVTVSGTEVSAQCKVTVEKVFSEEEKSALVEQASKNYVLVNAYPQKTATLKDVVLPGGWSWADDSIKLTADNARAVQYYTAIYKAEGAKAFTAALPVAISELTAVNIIGSAKMASTSSGEYSAILEYKGYQPQRNNSEFADLLEYKWSTEEAKAAYEIRTNGNDVEVYAKEVANDTVQKLICTVKTGENSLKSELALTVTKEPYATKITLQVSTEQPENAVKEYEFGVPDYEMPEMVVDAKNVTKENNVLKISAKALAMGQEIKVEKGLKWSSSNTSVVAVKADTVNSNGILTFKKPGSAVIYVTAQDGGKHVQELLVSVKDYEPILDNKVNFDIYVEGGSLLPVKAQNGNTVSVVTVQEQDKDTKEWKDSSKVEVVKVGEEFYVKAKEGYAPTKNEKLKTQLKITTTKAEYTKAITISVNAKNKPKASLKVEEKAALVYTDATAVYKLSSKTEIASIEQINGDGFELIPYEAGNTEVLLKAKNLNTETFADFKAKKSPLCIVKLKVNFKGYTDAAAQIIDLTVATNNKIPALKFKDVALVYGQYESVTQVKYDKINAPVNADITSETDGVGLRMTDDGEVKVIYSGNKAKSYVGKLTSESLSQPITVTGKIKVDEPWRYKLEMAMSKISLNTAQNIQENGAVAIAVSVPNNSTEIEAMAYQVDKKNQKLFNSGYLSITYSKKEQKVYVGLNKGMGEDIKNGTYKVNLVGKLLVNDREESMKPTTLSITLTDKAPQVTLKAKGNIDLVRRANTAIVYTPVYKNMTAVVESVKLSGAYANYFQAEVQDGLVYVSAQDGYSMSTKIKYPLTMTLGLDNGEEVTLSASIKPVCKLPKVKAEVTKATLYKTSPEVISYQVVITDVLTGVDRIERVEDKNSKYFNFMAEGDNISVSLTEEARKMKPGKYTISYQVYLEGAAYNVKPATLKLTVTVK